MDNQMIQGIQNALYRKIRTAFTPVEGLTYAAANHIGEAQYELVNDWQPVVRDTVLPAGTVFLKGTISIPADIVANDEYEDYLCVAIPDR